MAPAEAAVTLGGTGAVPAMPIDKVMRLFTGPNSDKLYERHQSAVARLCKAQAAGFPVQDLPQACQLLELTLALIERGTTDFVPTAITLIKTLSRPFIKTNSTDEFRLVGNITDVLTCVSKTLTAARPADIQVAAAEMLTVYASGYGTRPSALTKLPALHELSNGSPLRQYLVNHKLLVESGAVGHVVSGLALAILSQNEVLMMALCLTLAQATHHPGSVTTALNHGILRCLPSILTLDYTHPLVPVAIEILWNLLECAPRATREALLAPQPTLAQVAAGVTCADVAAAAAATAVDAAHSGESNGGEGVGACEGEVEGEGSQVCLPEEPGTQAEDGAVEQEATQGDDQPEPPTAPESAPAADLQDTGLSATGVSAQGVVTALGDDIVLPALAEALTGLFTSVLLRGYRAVDKELRNDILVTINLVIGTEHNELPALGHHPRGSCGAIFCAVAAAAGLFEPLLAVSTAPELGTHEHPDLVKAWALTTEESDLELRLLAWRTCAAVCVHTGPRGAVLPLAKSWCLTRVLIAYAEVTADAAAPAVASAAQEAQRRWSKDPLTQLRLCALSCLHSLAPMCPETYLSEGGPATTLRLLALSCHSHTVEGCLRHLHRLVQGAGEMAEALGAEGAVQTTLDVLLNPGHTQAVRHYCLLLLGALCRVNNENMRRLRHADGVMALLSTLARCKDSDHTLPSAYTVAALDAVWLCIVPDRKNTAKFLVEDGTDVLLDLLEVSNKGHRAVLLSVLCDLLENTKSHPFFMAWKSPRTSVTGAQLLLSVWREEEAARGMTEGGQLTNTNHPLTGTGRRTAWLPEEAAVYPHLAEVTLPTGASTSDVSGPGLPSVSSPTGPLRRNEVVSLLLQASTGERCLAKVYGCFHLLGFGNFNDLPAADAATLTLVEMYVKFRQGAEWERIRDSLECEGVRPTAPDRERIESGIEMAQHLGKICRDAQGALLDRELQRQTEQERQFYENMRAQRKLEQEARFYQRDKSQLTIAELREAKAKKEAMLRASIRDATTNGLNSITTEVC